MPARRIRVSDGRVGYKKTLPVPVKDGDGTDKNLDGVTLAATAQDPAGNNITPTATQKAAGSNICNIVISAAQMTTGGEGDWDVDLYVDSEAVTIGNEIVGWRFRAHAKETEA